MVTVVVGTGRERKTVSFTNMDAALLYLAGADGDAVVLDNGIPIAFRFFGTNDVPIDVSTGRVCKPAEA